MRSPPSPLRLVRKKPWISSLASALSATSGSHHRAFSPAISPVRVRAAKLNACPTRSSRSEVEGPGTRGAYIEYKLTAMAATSATLQIKAPGAHGEAAFFMPQGCQVSGTRGPGVAGSTP